jgi:hypothetical protein
MFAKSIKYFGLGSLGGLVNSLVVWLFGVVGINSALNVAIHPTLSASWLYPRVVWGGIWGAMFFIPKLHKSPWSSALIASFGPTLVMLFVVFPYKAHKGMGGLELGLLTPLLVVFFNYIWGLTVTLGLKKIGRR